jgi:hypothetical protein
MILALILAANVVVASGPVTVPSTLPIAARGLHCPGGGRAIGDPVAKSYILQELQIVTRDRDMKLIGYVYSAADGNDYIDLTPSDPREHVRLMRDDEPPKATTMMRYCFSEPWNGAR